jgi:hypothetical protein
MVVSWCFHVLRTKFFIYKHLNDLRNDVLNELYHIYNLRLNLGVTLDFQEHSFT